MKFYSRSISAILAFSIMGMSSAPAFATSGHLVDSVNFLPSTIYLGKR